MMKKQSTFDIMPVDNQPKLSYDTNVTILGGAVAFNVRKHLIKVQGNRLYLPVAARLVWFREEHPDWGIETHPVHIDTDKGVAVFEASVFNEAGRLMAKGTKMETLKGFHDYIEKAETGSIGRALAVAGFGTQFAPDMSEGGVVDSPIEERAAAQNLNNGYAREVREERVHEGTNGVKVSKPDISPLITNESSSACVECGSSMTAGQISISISRFGESLCPSCQRVRLKSGSKKKTDN